jgi:Uma2 family endonuclease
MGNKDGKCDVTDDKLEKLIKKKIAELESESLVDAPIEKFHVGFISFSNVQAALESLPDEKWRLWLDGNGNLYCFGLPKRCHESVSGYLAHEIIVQLERRGIPTLQSISIAASPDLVIGNQLKQPDMSVSPLPRKSSSFHADFEGNEFPNLVIEVSLMNESLDVLKKKMAVYLDRRTDIQMVIGIKICQKKLDVRQIIFLSCRRNEATKELVFDTRSTANLRATIPIREVLFYGSSNASVENTIQCEDAIAIEMSNIVAIVNQTLL